MNLVKLTITRFRWVACQLDYLCGFSSDFERRQALGQLPPTLHETYLRILQRLCKLPTPTQSKIQMCFQFIAFCPERLTTAQLCQAISTPEDIGSHLNEDNMVSEDDISTMCGSLLKKSADDTSFEFAHFSVREFLEHRSLSETPGLGCYRISQPECYGLLATQSLRYLQLSNFAFDPPDLENLKKHASMMWKNDVYSFHSFAAKYALELIAHTDSQSIFHSLMISLFHPSKTPCLVLFAYSVCFPLTEHFAANGFIAGDVQTWHHQFAKKLLSDDCQSIHLAAALNLPDVCEYLISTGSDCSTRSPFGTPFELSVASFLRLVLNEFDWKSVNARHHHLRRPIQTLLATGTQRNSTVEIFERTSPVNAASDPSLQSEDKSLLFPACIVAFVQNDFRVLQRLLSRGMTLKGSAYITIFRELMHQSVESIREDEHPLLEFLQHIGTLLEPETGWQLEVGHVIWNTAVDLGLVFARNPSVTDFRITLSKDALLSRAFATIKDHDSHGLQECLADGRLDLLERHQNPQQPHTDREPVYLTLLHFAVLEDNLQAASQLAKAGSDPNIPSIQHHHRWLPIHQCSSIDVFEELLLYGAQATDVEVHTGYNIWHLYGSIPEAGHEFLDSVQKRHFSSTAEALLTKSKDGKTPLEVCLASGSSSMSHEESVSRAIALISICDRVLDFWTRHEPVFGVAAEFGSEKIIRRLMEVGAKIDPVEPGLKTPLHRLGIESTSSTVQCLNGLFPGALEMRVDGQLPLQLYLEKCSHEKYPIEDKVTQQLISTESLESIDGTGTMLWDYYCHSSLTNRDNYDLLNDEPGLGLISVWLLRQNSAMQLYERAKGRNGLDLIFSRLITLDPTQEPFSLISHDTLEQAIKASSYWEEAKNGSNALRFLQFAIQNQAYEVVNMLLDHGVSVSEAVDDYSSVQIACKPPLAMLLCAASEGKDILRKMLDLADPVHLKDHDKGGLTMLHRLATPHADSKELHWLIEILLAKGLDINRKSQFGQRSTPIKYHLSQGSFSCAEYLFDMGADPRIAGAHEPDAVMEASYRGFSPLMNKLLQFSKTERSVIDWKRKVDIRLILDGGRAVFLGKANAVHLICWGGNLDSVAFYVENNLIDDLDIASATGWTAMHIAALRGNTSMIEYLNSKGCKIMPETVDKDTPLHLAVKSGHQKAAELLLRLGARDIPDATGMTPKMHASKGNDKSMVRLIRETLASEERRLKQLHGEDLPQMTLKALNNAMEKAILFDDLEQCKRLYAIGCPLDASMKRRPPLIVALDNGRLDIAEWLIDNGATTTARMCQHAYDVPCFNVMEMCLKRPGLCKILPKLFDRCTHDGSGWPLLDNRSFLSAIRNRNTEGLCTLLNLLDEKSPHIRYRVSY